jgi:CheY-like chemotaxis protein
LQIDVIDTGIGIAADKRQAIFDPFVQADSSIAPRFGGTGLGLAISRSIAGLLGGTLSVESCLGAGSTFTLTIDAEPPEATHLDTRPATAANTPARPTSAGMLEGSRILVVEDNPFNRKLVRVTLSRAGAIVDSAENGQEGLEMVSAAKYDLVLMDVQMPVMDGYTATARLRESGYRGPIIALTAHTLPMLREKCLAAGCDAFVGKPIDLDHLKAVVAQFLSAPLLRRLSDECHFEAVKGATNETDDSAEFREVVSEYVAWLPEVIAQLRDAVAGQEFEALAAIGHTLKGSGGTFGFPELTEIAERLELAANQRLDAAIRAAVDDLTAFVERFPLRAGQLQRFPLELATGEEDRDASVGDGSHGVYRQAPAESAQ